MEFSGFKLEQSFLGQLEIFHMNFIENTDLTGSATTISVVAPCYNEGEVVRLFCQRMLAVLAVLPGGHEIILVDDGSSDTTWDVISDEASKNSVVSGIRLSRNHGHQLAITAGLAAVRGDYILTIDADL